MNEFCLMQVWHFIVEDIDCFFGLIEFKKSGFPKFLLVYLLVLRLKLVFCCLAINGETFVGKCDVKYG